MASREIADPIAEYTRSKPVDSAQRCQRRISDHTDFTDCGAPVSGLGFCEAHRQEIEGYLRDSAHELRARLVVIERRIEEIGGTECP